MPVIKIENLWKEYRLGVIGHGTLTHDLQSWWAKVRGKEDPNSKITPMLAGQEKQIEGDRFWALRDINLEVKQGEILGIIGKNGAGKSTLLKILSRVTAPTKGNVKVKGRIASLLEVGTGFHPELTGRENIFMNGAILGMSKQEIKAKLDEIIDFSGVEEFIDTPVKRYSSGMNVRLAFAVAAHLEPEILVVDEVLAVGDAEFQKKCLGKMGDISKEGRTIFFVSHNMIAVEQLCSYGIQLDNGLIAMPKQKVKDVVSAYLNDGRNKGLNRTSWENSGKQYLHEKFIPHKLWLTDAEGDDLVFFARNNKGIWVNTMFEVRKIDTNLVVAVFVYEKRTKNLIFVTSHTDTEQPDWPNVCKGINRLRFMIPPHFLNEGEYLIELVCSIHKKEWILQPQKLDITVMLKISGGLSKSPYWESVRGGYVAPLFRWKADDE